MVFIPPDSSVRNLPFPFLSTNKEMKAGVKGIDCWVVLSAACMPHGMLSFKLYNVNRRCLVQAQCSSGPSAQ